jgi:hypothetical protein
VNNCGKAIESHYAPNGEGDPSLGLWLFLRNRHTGDAAGRAASLDHDREIAARYGIEL